MKMFRVEINFIAIFLLLLMLVNQHHTQNESGSRNSFRTLLKVMLMTTVAEAITWMVDEVPGTTAVFINFYSNAVYYLLGGFTMYDWLLFTADFFRFQGFHSARIKWLLKIPLVLSILLSIINVFKPFLFTIDSSGYYIRQPGGWMNAVAAIIYLLVAFIICFREFSISKTQIHRQTALQMIGYLLLPVGGYALQSAFYGMPVYTIACTISLFMIFINYQNKQIYVDELTHIGNRKELYLFVNNLERDSALSNNLYVLLLMDLNGFKGINDQYGHICGDEIIITTASFLKACSHSKTGCVIRYGGDEFILICPAEEKESIIDQFYTQIDQYNTQGNPWQLSISVGCQYFIPSEHNFEEIIRLADKKMYDEKERLKLQKA